MPSPPPTENFAVTPIVTHGTHQVRAEQGGWSCLRATRRRRSVGLPGRVSIQAPGNPHDERVTATHAHHPKLQHHFDDMAQQAEASTLGMWVFLVTEIMFFGGLFLAYLVYRTQNPMAFQEASAHLNVTLGRDQHRRPDRQLADDGARGPGGADQRAAEDPGDVARAHDGPRRGLPRRQGHRVPEQVHGTTSCPGPNFTWHGQYPGRRGDVLLALLLHDRPARAAHDHRPRAS